MIKTLVFGEDVAGFPTTICVIFLFSGLQLFCTGILGQYLSKTYLETKNRPIYITKETEDIYRKNKALRQEAEAAEQNAPETDEKNSEAESGSDEDE